MSAPLHKAMSCERMLETEKRLEEEVAKLLAKAQRNFTDPESRIMKDGATKGFEQAYNAQAAVDGEAQVIVASAVTQQTNDKQQLVPMLKKVAAEWNLICLTHNLLKLFRSGWATLPA